MFKPTSCRETKWKALVRGLVKANWDNALDRVREKLGIGIVVRDYEGKVVVVPSCSLYVSLKPTQVKAHGAWKLAEFCHSKGFCTVVVEEDVLEIVQAL